MVFVEGEPLLPSLEQKSFAQFEQELFQVTDERGFKVRLAIAGLLVEPEKLQDQRFLEDIFRLRDDLSLFRQPFHTRLVAAEREPLIEAGCFLAFQ